MKMLLPASILRLCFSLYRIAFRSGIKKRLFNRVRCQQNLHSIYTSELVVELVVRAPQLDSVAELSELVRALHRNRRAAGSIPARGPI